MSSINKTAVAKIIATFFYIGYMKRMPGTFGSLAAFPLFIALNCLLVAIRINTLWLGVLFYAVFMLLLALLGFWAVNNYIKTSEDKDPREVVIDEVIGQMIAFIMPSLLFMRHFVYVSSNINHPSLTRFTILVLPIILFRIFDISKVGLVGYYDKHVKGAKGVIMDDVVAGIYAGGLASVVLQVVLYA